jgi:hypothetical protein
MKNLTVMTKTDRGATFRNLTRKIFMIDGIPHAKLDGVLIVLESESFNGKPVLNKYEYTIQESAGTIWL